MNAQNTAVQVPVLEGNPGSGLIFPCLTTLPDDKSFAILGGCVQYPWVTKENYTLWLILYKWIQLVFQLRINKFWQHFCISKSSQDM